MDDDTFRERQANEFLCLQSVYDKELRDLRLQDAWKVWRPPEMVITLIPQQSTGLSKEVYAQIDLHVKCSAKYPDEVPDILLENEKGLSTQNVADLHKELLQLASDLRGEVMILELAQKVQTYLHLHNKPRHGSFYDEMLCNRKRQEEEKAIETKRKEEKAREAMQEEITRKQEELREEGRQRKEHAKQLNLGSPDVQGSSMSFQFNRDREFSPVSNGSRVNVRRRGTSKSDSLSSQDSLTCDHSVTAQVRFPCRGGVRIIQRGKCLGHSLRGSVVYSGIDVATGDMVTITEWTLACTAVGRRRGSHDRDCHKEEFKNLMKQLATVEQELASLSKLQHRTLVHYLGMCYVEEKNAIVVSILQEFVSGGNLAYHLMIGISVQYDLLQHYASGILDALSFLHRNSVVHKSLRDTSVFVENRGLIRVSDYSLDKRLYELYCSVCKEEAEDLFPPSLGRGGKKADVFRLGILCLSLVKGYIVDSIIPDVPTSLPSPLKDFLEKCLVRTEQERWSADQLLDHSFLKPSICQEPSPMRDIPAMNEEPNVDELNEMSEVPDIPAEPSGSRLRKEFDIILWLGRGGFGDVYKVRNKLDGGVYAIKRISLNPSNKQLNRKITREVKLLSRLNHENVVRYFNSWMETAWMDYRSDDDSDEDEIDSNLSSGKSYLRRPESSFSRNVDKTIDRSFPPQVDASMEMSISFENNGLPLANDSSDDDDEEDEDVFGTSFMPKLDVSDGIVFEASSRTETNGASFKESDTVDGGQSHGGRKVVQFMYIQMEFCDKSTLRNAIDDGLYEDETRVWRLFREIVEGLAHIHQQGMIHRDLKPVNIFLDSSDHVKIGDFGLATTNVLSHPMDGTSLEAQSCTRRGVNLEALSSEFSENDGNLTSWVGTVLYISPEVADPSSRSPYNEKVDVYSLGIICFEMCYHPLSTAMERVKVLDSLRRPEITFPPDFDENVKPKEVALVKWLLDHDPCKRPTTHELLQSSLLPPPQMEEAELHEVFRHTISNPQSKIYKHMISSLFEQEVTAAANVTYDIDVHKGTFNNKTALTHKFVTEALIRVFENHGAIPVHTPLLMPKSDLYKKGDGCVRLVDHGGGIVSLPYDLRVPFCRFVVKNNIMNLKRFYIASVFRERKVFGCHPRSLHECAFDIVTPSPGSLLADAEVLSAIWEIISEFQPLRERSHLLRLNHSSLLKGILSYCNVPDDKQLDVCAVINEAKVNNLGKYEIQMRLIALGLADQSAIMLHHLIEMEGPIGKLGSMVRSVVKRRSRATALIDQGIKELETILTNLESLGVKLSVVVTPNLVYGAQHFSGIVFQFACELKMKKRRKAGSLDVVAAGGRYDQLISRIRSMMDVTGNQDSCQSAVGVSIAVEKLTSALLECEDFQPPGAFDVLVCAVGNQLQLKQKSVIVSKLWNASISAHVHYNCIDTIEEVQELCHELRASHIVILKEGDIQQVKLRSLDIDRFTERIVPTSNLVEVLQKLLMNKTDTQEIFRVDSHRPDRIIAETSVGVNSSNQANVIFLTVEKLAAFTKRRYEAQIMSQVAPTLQLFSAKVNIEILALELNIQVLTTISCHIELTANEKDFEGKIGTVIEKHPRHKKQLVKLGDQLYDLIFEKK